MAMSNLKVNIQHGRVDVRILMYSLSQTKSIRMRMIRKAFFSGAADEHVEEQRGAHAGALRDGPAVVVDGLRAFPIGLCLF